LDRLDNETSSSFLNVMKMKRKPLKHYLKDCDQEVEAMILRMLEFDASERISAEEALELPCLQEFRRNKESVCKKYIAVELDDNKRLDLEEYRRQIYRDIERRYPEFNNVTPVVRIYRAHHSLNNKISDYIQARKNGRSHYKIHNSTSLFHKNYLATTMSSSPPKIYKREPKHLVSLHKDNKENCYASIKTTIYEEKEGMASKIFKRKAHRNLWKRE
jgi:hypothetical protein